LPAASRAVTVMMLLPLTSGIDEIAQLVVPLATPLPPRSFAQVTCVTPTLSAVVPVRLIVEDVVEYVAAVVGVAIATVGRVVSPGAVVIVHVNVCDAVRVPSEARAVTEYVPADVPAPEIKPVLAITVRPGGSPVALYVSGCDWGSEP